MSNESTDQLGKSSAPQVPNIKASSALVDGLDASAHTPAFSPLYRQIKDLLLQRLQSGEWRPAEAIPSEHELAAQFKVSQGTVRKAIDELAAENLLVRKQGKGTFVATHAARHVQYRFLKLRPDHGTADDEGRAQRHILFCKRIRSSAEIAKPLQLRTGDAVIHIKRILSFLETPTILENIWLPAHAFKGITEQMISTYKGPTYALFEEAFDVRMVRAEEKIRAINANADDASNLKIPEHCALLCVDRLSYTYNNTPMELRRGLYKTDTHHYFNELN